MMKNSELFVWKLWDGAHLPEYGSEWAACFDLKASLRGYNNGCGDAVVVYNQTNTKSNRRITAENYITLYSNERMLIPTGVIFDLREGESLRIHPRSGLSLKSGIVLANCEGVVDADYVNQTYVMLHNISDISYRIWDGDRIAQGEIISVQQVMITQSDREPESKTNRQGGFGSTGVK